MNRFNHLNVPETWQHYWSKYPEGYTILEALLNWVKQVDDMVDNVNEWNAYLEKFVETFDEKLRPHVREFLQEMVEDGRLADIINQEVFGNINRKIDDLKLNVKDYGAIGDGTTDDTVAIQIAIDDAIEQDKILYFPYGTYYTTQSLTISGHLTLEGHKPIGNVDIGPSNIKGIAGNIFNIPTGRVRLNVHNLSIEGNGNNRGFNGQFGGEFNNARFKNLDYGVHNEMSYATQFIHSYFSNCNTGAYLKNANAVLFDYCYFSGNGKGVETGDLSYMIAVTNCLINFTPLTTRGFILKGNVIFEGNYVEAFGSASGGVCLDYSFSKFNVFTLSVSDNYFGGANYIDHAVTVSLFNNESGGRLGGSIQRNAFFNLKSDPVVLGTFNDFEGLIVENNNPDVSAINRHPRRGLVPFSHVKLPTNTALTGTNVVIPLNTTIVKDNTESITATNYSVRRSGSYLIRANVTIKNVIGVSGDLRSASIKLRRNGVVSQSTVHSLAVPNTAEHVYATIYVETIVEATTGVTIDMVADNAGLLHGGTFTVQYLGKE